MAEEYTKLLDTETCSRFLTNLDELNVAYRDVFVQWAEKELAVDEANAVCVKPDVTEKINVQNCRDVIGFQDMTSSTTGSKDLKIASSVLDFVLNYVIQKDESWRLPVTVDDGRQLYPSYWLSVLKTKNWIQSSDLKHFEPLNRDNLERLLTRLPTLQVTETVQSFLEIHFGLNLSGILAVKLKAMEITDKRIAIFDQLLALSQQESESIVEKMENQLENARVVSRNKRLGNEIERIVMEQFQDSGLKTQWTGIGSDIGLSLAEDVGRVTVSTSSGSGRVVIEVKATTSEVVRITLRQAEEALNSKTRFILCVADLRDCTFLDDLRSETELSRAKLEEVVKKLRFYPSLSNHLDTAVSESEKLVGHQIELKDVEVKPGVRISFEESSIRIGISSEIWMSGVPFTDAVNLCNQLLEGNSSTKA